MSTDSRCPKCSGVVEVHNPRSNSSSQSSHGGSRIIAPDGDVIIPEGNHAETYFTCSTCEIDFIPSELTIEDILPNLKIIGYVEIMLNHYFGVTPISTIFTNETTILIKNPLNHGSFLTQAKAKKQIIFITTYGNIKISGTILKKGRNGYKMTTMGDI